MAWRPTQYLVKGELDNTIPGKVIGWMKFVGKGKKVIFNLKGDFHRDIRGTKIKFSNPDPDKDGARGYMYGLSDIQEGNVGDITAGLPPQDYCNYPYIEWYSDDNGRVVLELDKEDIEIIGTPIPIAESFPVDRKEQSINMRNFMEGMAKSIGMKNPEKISENGITAIIDKDKLDNN